MNWNSDKSFKLVAYLLFAAFVWYFTSIIAFVVIASLIGVAAQPLMRLFGKIKIKKKPISETFRAAISLIVMLSVIIGFLAILIPAINSQASALMKVDYVSIADNIGDNLNLLEKKLRDIGSLEANENIEQRIVEQFRGLASSIQLNNIFSGLVSATGNIFMGIFSVLFLSFFFIKDHDLFTRIVMLFIPENKYEQTEHILRKINKMLTRYFTGILIEVSTMMVLITIGGLFVGLENAILIGFIGGLMNLIPYIGPLIGAAIASILVTMTNIYLGIDHTMGMVGGILLVFAIANMIDNFLLQPIIYSNSVNAHPIEIFIVIIMGGTMGGPLGMIVAIPIYTVIRITVKEFFGDKIFIKRLMKDL